MLRLAIILLAVFALPFVLWTLWSLYKGERRPAPVPLLLGAGFACSVAALLIVGLLEVSQGSRDGLYAPPSLEDGQIRPGRFEDREREPSSDPT